MVAIEKPHSLLVLSAMLAAVAALVGTALVGWNARAASLRPQTPQPRTAIADTYRSTHEGASAERNGEPWVGPNLTPGSAPCGLTAESGEFAGISFESQPPTNTRVPTLVMFHGRGQSPEMMRDALADLGYAGRVLYPRGLTRSGQGWRWLEARSRHPGFHDQLADVSLHLADLMVEVEACFGPFVVAGHSQGAHLAYAMAASMPNRLLAAVGTSGTLPPTWSPGSFQVPVATIHADADPVVPYDWTLTMATERGARMRTIQGRRHRFAGPIRLAFYEEIERLFGTPMARSDARIGLVPANGCCTRAS